MRTTPTPEQTAIPGVARRHGGNSTGSPHGNPGDASKCGSCGGCLSSLGTAGCFDPGRCTRASSEQKLVESKLLVDRTCWVGGGAAPKVIHLPRDERVQLMKLSRDFYIKLVLALLLKLTVIAFVLLPTNWCEAKNTALLAGLQMVSDAVVWLVESGSRSGTALVVMVLLAILLYGYLRLERRVMNLELYMASPMLMNNHFVGDVSADPDISLSVPMPLPSVSFQDALVKPSVNGTPVTFAAPVIEIKEVRPPAEQLPRFMKATRRCKGLQPFPEAPSQTWSLGFACVKGNVREQNQDYGFHFVIGGTSGTGRRRRLWRYPSWPAGCVPGGTGGGFLDRQVLRQGSRLAHVRCSGGSEKGYRRCIAATEQGRRKAAFDQSTCWSADHLDCCRR